MMNRVHLFLLLWAILLSGPVAERGYSLTREHIQKAIDREIAVSGTVDEEALERFWTSVRRFGADEWPSSQPFSDKLDVENIIITILPKGTAPVKSTWEGRHIRLRWDDECLSSISVDFAVYPCTEDAQFRLLQDVWREPQHECFVNPSWLPDTVVITRRSGMLIACHNVFFHMQYNIPNRCGTYTEEDQKAFRVFVKNIVDALCKAPIVDDNIEPPKTMLITQGLLPTGTIQNVEFAIPQGLADFQIHLNSMSDDLCDQIKVERYDDGRLVWVGRLLKSGHAYFEIRGTGPRGQILKDLHSVQIGVP